MPSEPVTECALAIVWQEILYGIFSMLGRVACLAACIRKESGRYRHEKLTRRLTPDVASHALSLAHRLAWRDWIHGSIEAHSSDLILYLTGLPHPFAETLFLWRDQKPFLTFIPPSATDDEQILFVNNLNKLLTLLCNQHNRRRMLCPQTGSFNPALEGDSSSLVNTALVIVGDKYMDPDFSLASLSEILHVSERRLGRALKGHTGQTFRQHLRDIRVKNAAQLLEGTDHGIKAIAAMIGYGDASHFIQYFREATGKTPGEFRSSQRANAATVAGMAIRR